MAARFEVMPGRFVTGDIYDQVRAVLAAEAPSLLPALTWEQFTHPVRVYAIPDGRGETSKVELILFDTPEATVKVNNWWLSDLRSGERPAPHNHRWRTMRSWRLAGGLRDHVYRRTAAGVHGEARSYDDSRANVLDHHEFHEVVEVEPGETWTVFIGDASVPGDWGYLDPETGRYTHNAATSPDPNFATAFRALNPHAAGV